MLAANIINVEVTADEIDSSNGFSLREAVIAAHNAAAADDVTINLQAGETYKLRSGGEFGDFEIRRDLTINGHGAVIDGDLATRLFEIHQQPGGVDVVFNDITLREGMAKDAGAVSINNEGGSVTFVNSILEDNRIESNANADGGAIRAVGGSLTIDGTTIRNNQAIAPAGQNFINNGANGKWARGAGIYADSVNIVIRNGSVLQNNVARAGDGGTGFQTGGDGGWANGGAIYLIGADSSLEIRDSDFIGNEAVSGQGGNTRDDDSEFAGSGGRAQGGAIATVDGVTSLTIVNSIFSNNLARALRGGHATNSDGDNEGAAGEGGGARGGAVLTATAALLVADTEFSGNQALGGQGGDSDRGSSGDGGFAQGGAINVAPSTQTIDIRGTITTGDSGETLLSGLSYTTVFSSNVARGGSGGSKTDTDLGGGRAGSGGLAYGGAIHQEAGVSIIDGVVLNANMADGGFGGHGAASADGCGDEICMGTAGGNNGPGEGGAIKSDGPLTLTDSTVIGNVAAGGLPVEGVRVAAGLGGFNTEGTGLSGGRGGHAVGGGLFVYQADFAVLDSGFSGNTAYGGIGGGGGIGFGLDDDPNVHGGGGGRGGDARGAAIGATLTEADTVRLEKTLVTSNLTIAGHGGVGGDGAQGGDVDNEANGGRGGQGGNASGGGISIINWSDSNNTEVSIVDVLISANVLIGGDGGGGGRGGIGEDVEYVVGEHGNTDLIGFSYPGGDGGHGGNGGLVYGGGIFLRSAEATIDGSTIDSNAISGGVGGRGGAGGSGALHRDDFDITDIGLLGTRGGDGGDGGDARLASGGGIAIQGGFLELTRSTLVNNIVVSGSGGVGGDGAPGREYGGDGGDGGNGADARGGAIGVVDGASPMSGVSRLFVLANTVARNTVNAGSAGFGGAGGELINNEIIVGVTEHHIRTNQKLIRRDGKRFPLTSKVVLTGSSAGIDPAFSNPTPQSLDLVQSDLEFTSGIEDDPLTDAYVGAAFGGGVLLGTSAGAGTFAVLGAITSASVFTTAATTGVGAAAASGALAGAVGIGFAAIPLFVGAALAAKFTVAVASGDSAYDALQSTIEIDPSLLGSGVNFGALFYTGGNNKVYVPPTPIAAGNAGNRSSVEGTPRGPGIDGSVTLGRTIVASNEARTRSLTREEAECDFLNNPDPNDPACRSIFVPMRYVQRTVTEQSLPDITPGDFVGNFGGNLIGILDSSSTKTPKNGDQFGSVESPIDPLLDAPFGFYGGYAPTIRLLTDSPATDAVDVSASPFLATSQTSQNGVPTTGVTDIGAWAGDPLIPVISGPIAPVSFDPFRVSIDFGSEVTPFTSDVLNISGGQIQGEITHVENGLYQFDVLPTAFEISISIDKNEVITTSRETNEPSNLYSVTVDLSLDDLKPSSRVDVLPTTSGSLSFDITVSAADPIPDGGLASGVSDVDLYVAEDDGPFMLFQTQSGPGTSFTFPFAGQDETQYWFRSISRDVAGNEESKPVVAETSIYVPDRTAPTTAVEAIHLAGNNVWLLQVRGQDRGGSGLDRIRIDYVEEGGAVTTLGTFDAGPADENGVHHVSVPFLPRLVADLNHYFTSIGIDENGNEEIVPPVSPQSHDASRSTGSSVVVTPSRIRHVDIQNQARQRSFIRHIDLRFTPNSGLGGVMNSLADSDPGNDRLVLERLPSGGGAAERIDLTGMLTRNGDLIGVDFGQAGLGGDPRSAGANGNYRFTIELLAGGTRTFDFHRLLGDANGDGIVDRIDMMDVLAGLRTPHENADIDGDGKVDLVDRGIVQREMGSEIIGGGSSGIGTGGFGGGEGGSAVFVSPWKNPFQPADINGDGSISPIDALMVINELNGPRLTNERGTPAWEASFEADSGKLLDASGDGRISPIDALVVVNYLNRMADSANSEGEMSPPETAMVPPLDYLKNKNVDHFFSEYDQVAELY